LTKPSGCGRIVSTNRKTCETEMNKIFNVPISPEMQHIRIVNAIFNFGMYEVDDSSKPKVDPSITTIIVLVFDELEPRIHTAKNQYKLMWGTIKHQPIFDENSYDASRLAFVQQVALHGARLPIEAASALFGYLPINPFTMENEH